MELSELCNISQDGIKWQLKKMQKENIIRRVGPDKGGYWEIIDYINQPPIVNFKL